MRYSQIRAFHHVAQQGGFSAAAAELNQTQPALSDQVRRLERDHDVLLFHRDHRQVRLTEAGEQLLRLTRRFFEAEAQIAAYLSENRAAVEGRLRIVADSALHITAALGRFRAVYPQVMITLRTGNSEEVLRALRNYDAEIGVLGSVADAPDLTRFDLGETPIIAIAARGMGAAGRMRLADLARYPLVFREPGSRTRAAVEHAAARAGLTLRPVMEVEGREAMREVVASGAGIGFVSLAEAGEDARLIRIALDEPGLTMVETLVHLSMRREVPVIRSFVRTLQEVYPGRAAERKSGSAP